MTDEDNGAARALRHRRYPLEHRTHLIGPVHIHLTTQVCLYRIDDNELRSCLLDGLLQPFIAEGEFLLALINDQHTSAVGTVGCQPRLDSVGQTILGGLVDHIHWLQHGNESPLEKYKGNTAQRTCKVEQVGVK